jgi:hypothetical protein
MKRELAVVGLFAIVFCTLLFGFGYSQSTLPLDEQFTLIYQDQPQANVFYKDFYVDLTTGDRISISISVTGAPIEFDIEDSARQFLLTKEDTNSVNEEWTATKNDTFDFYFHHRGGALAADSQVHFTAQKVAEGQGGGGGFDPTPIVVVVMVLLAVLISAFFIVRLRKQPPPPPPAEGQPPPPP